MKKLSKKNKAKKLNSIMTYTIIFLLGVLLGVIICNFDNISLTNDIELDVIDNCDIEFKKYLNLEDSEIYLNCLNEVKIKNKYIYKTLKEYLKNNKIEEFLNNLEEDSTLWDGGTKIYKGDNITVIKCNTLEGNKDIYIGTNNLDQTKAFDNGACGKNYLYEKQFERTYKLDNIKILEEIPIEDQKIFLYELTLSDDLDNNTKISVVFDTNLVKVLEDNTFAHNLKSKHLKLLEEGHNYIFTFENKYEELIKDNIKDIFAKCTIKDISLSK